MLILGDYLWLQHYHAELNAQTMPEYVAWRNRTQPGLYTLYAHYFAQRWDNAQIPDYDLETDELVYRGRNGGEIRRETVAWLPAEHNDSTLPAVEGPAPRSTAGTAALVHIV